MSPPAILPMALNHTRMNLPFKSGLSGLQTRLHYMVSQLSVTPEIEEFFSNDL